MRRQFERRARSITVQDAIPNRDRFRSHQASEKRLRSSCTTLWALPLCRTKSEYYRGACRERRWYLAAARNTTRSALFRHFAGQRKESFDERIAHLSSQIAHFFLRSFDGRLVHSENTLDISAHCKMFLYSLSSRFAHAPTQ